MRKCCPLARRRGSRGQHCPYACWSPRRTSAVLYDWSSGDEAIDDDDYRDNKKNVNQTAADMYDEEPEYPQDEENYRDRPKHDGILARSE